MIDSLCTMKMHDRCLHPESRASRRRWLQRAAAWPLLLGPPSHPGPARAAPGAELLTVTGARLGAPAQRGRFAFDLDALQRLPQRKVTTSTPWYKDRSEFTGPLLRDVLRAAGAATVGSGTLRCTAVNDYRVRIPVEDAKRYDVVVAHLLNGQPMSVREKGPLFVIYPFDEQPQLRNTTYFSRCIWQLRLIEVVA
jgi:hypothetical protein